MEEVKAKNFLTRPWIVAVLAIFSCFLWGSAFPSIKQGYSLFMIENNDTYSKILFAGLRFFIAGLMVIIVCILFRYSLKVSRQQLLRLIYLGLLQTTLQYYFFYIGMSNISGTSGAILSALSTFFSVIIAPIFFSNDKLNKNKLFGVIIGFIGIVILNYDGIASNTFKLNGEGFLIISSLISALASIFTKKLTGLNIPSFAISGYQLAIGGIVLIFIGILGNNGVYINFSLEGNILLIYMGFISAAAFSIWTVLLQYNNVATVSIYKFSIPLFGAILSFFILGERNINFSLLISAILVIVGIFFINASDFKKDK